MKISRHALTLSAECERFLLRELTLDELILCEEMVLNYFINPLVKRVWSLSRKKAKRDFRLIYAPIANGILRGAARRTPYKRIVGKLREVYLEFSAWLQHDMSTAEVEAVVTIADADVSMDELSAAMRAANERGVNHIAYVRAIIDSNRGQAAMRMAHKNLRSAASVLEHMTTANVDGLPKVEIIRQRWTEKLEQLRKDAELKRAERGATEALDHEPQRHD